MGVVRKLSYREREFLLQVCRKDMSRRILRFFMWLWKMVFFLGIYGIVKDVCRGITEKNYWTLFSLLGIPIVYLFFWAFPGFVLRKVDLKHEALKYGEVYLKEAKLYSVRVSKERRTSSSREYTKVYFAAVYYSCPDETFEVLADRKVSGLQRGDRVFVLRFPGKQNAADTEYAVLPDFVEDDTFTLPI